MTKVSIQMQVDEEDALKCKEIFLVLKDENGVVLSGNYISEFTILPSAKLEELKKIDSAAVLK